MGEETQKWGTTIVEMEADQRMPVAPQSTREQGLEHKWSAKVLVALATNFLNVTRQDASRIHSSVDKDLSEGLRVKTASHCWATLTFFLSLLLCMYNKRRGGGNMLWARMQ